MLRNIRNQARCVSEPSSLHTTQAVIQKRFQSDNKLGKSPPIVRAVSESITIPESKNRNKRRRYSYDENHTAALRLFTPTNELELNLHDPLSLLEISKENIVEHARRRVELFFYLLVAYYESGVIPNRGHTVLQYGRGRNSLTGENITQACHSSLFGSLVDDDRQYSILSGTHLSHSLNSTVELPAFVNKLDDELENDYACRTNGLYIIRQVSLGVLNPIEGLAEFFKMLRTALDKIKSCVIVRKHSKPYLLRDSMDSPIDVKRSLMELIEQGSFANKWDDDKKVINENYIDMLLRITPDEKSKCIENSDALSDLRTKKMYALRDELLQVEASEDLAESLDESSSEESSTLFKMEL